MWGDVIESVHLKRTRAETKFRLLFLACETLQFSMVMTNINTKCTHSTCSDMSQPGGGGGMFVVKSCFFNFFQQN